MKKLVPLLLVVIVVCGIFYVKDSGLLEKPITDISKDDLESVADSLKGDAKKTGDSLLDAFNEGYDKVTQQDINYSINNLPEFLSKIKIPLPTERDIEYLGRLLEVTRNLAFDFSCLNDYNSDPTSYLESIISKVDTFKQETPSDNFKEVSEVINTAFEDMKAFSQSYKVAYDTGDSKALGDARQGLISASASIQLIIDSISTASSN